MRFSVVQNLIQIGQGFTRSSQSVPISQIHSIKKHAQLFHKQFKLNQRIPHQHHPPHQEYQVQVVEGPTKLGMSGVPC